jgi:hypothetical protein
VAKIPDANDSDAGDSDANDSETEYGRQSRVARISIGTRRCSRSGRVSEMSIRVVSRPGPEGTGAALWMDSGDGDMALYLYPDLYLYLYQCLFIYLFIYLSI